MRRRNSGTTSCVVVLVRGDPAFPARLGALPDCPRQVFVDGTLPEPGRRWVALVGSRKATPAGRDIAHQLARGLAEAGVVVVSGGAVGIDRAAHEGALAGAGTTVVVLPTSLGAPYPRGHAPLFRQVVAAGGACLAEHDDDAPIAPWRFVARNRLIAALAEVVVVVEARASSGTAATAVAARRLGRRVAALPWRVGDEGGAGCLALLHAGAQLVRGVDDVLALIGMDVVLRGERPAAAGVVGLLRAGGPQTLEVLAVRLGRPVREVLAELTTLELGGEIIREAGGLVRAR